MPAQDDKPSAPANELTNGDAAQTAGLAREADASQAAGAATSSGGGQATNPSAAAAGGEAANEQTGASPVGVPPDGDAGQAADAAEDANAGQAAGAATNSDGGQAASPSLAAANSKAGGGNADAGARPSRRQTRQLPPQTMVNRIRCLVFWIIWYIFTTPTAAALFVLFWMPPLWCYAIARFWTTSTLVIMRWTLGIDYRVIGAERLKTTPPCVLVSNHESLWETIALTTVMPTLTWVIKFELLFVPLFGQVVSLTQPIILKRAQRFRALAKMTERGIESIKQGRWVAIFPQGTRQHNVIEPRFHTGAAMLAIKARCPLLPVAHNSGDLWGAGPLDKRPGTISIAIGPPIAVVDENGNALPVSQIHRQMTESLYKLRAGITDPSVIADAPEPD